MSKNIAEHLGDLMLASGIDTCMAWSATPQTR
jgi:hypothetical protein